MHKFRIIERGDNGNAAHYIFCNICEQISPFVVRIENQFDIVFMNEVLKIEKEEK